MKIGDTITMTKLTKTYDRYAVQVLGDHYTRLDRERRQHQRITITKELPSKEEYTALRNKRYTLSVSTLVGDAYSAIEELGSEMRDVYDNMPENLQQGDLGERRSNAADELENFSEPDLPELAEKIETLFLPHSDTSSRAKAYIREFGRESWELDALEPTILSGLVRRAVEELIDRDEWDVATQREQKEIAVFEKLARSEDL